MSHVFPLFVIQGNPSTPFMIIRYGEAYLEANLVQRPVGCQHRQGAYSCLGEGMQERVATTQGDDLHARQVQYLVYHRV
jgi:hypothetical protein